MSRLPGMCLAALLWAGSAGAAAKAAPFAVMPFKNIGNNAELAWLSLGMAETMISDLKQQKFAVVERSQVDAALSEIKLQQAVAVDASTAAQLGKVVGARTVVLGGYQTAQKKLRITARFVDVQTGVVKETAKVTGNVSEIFALQDKIVAKLIGKKSKVRRRRAGKEGPRGKKATGKGTPAKAGVLDQTPALDAYRLFGESLGERDPMARRVALLKALKADPDFAYAQDELAALERRLDAYKKEALRRALERVNTAMSIYRDTKKTGDERGKAALDALRELQVNRQQTALLEVCREIIELKLPPYYTINPAEYAMQACFSALQQLERNDEALAVGEAFLKQYPASQQHQSVTLNLEGIIKKKRKRKKLYDAYDEELKDIEKREAQFRKNHERRPDEERFAGQMVMITAQRCGLLARHFHVDEAEKACRAFIAAEGDNPASDTWVYQARTQLFFMYRNIGKFDEARLMGADLIVHHGEKGASVADNARWFPR